MDEVVKKIVTECCNVDEMFSGLSSRALREKYYKQHLNYVVINVLFCYQYNVA